MKRDKERGIGEEGEEECARMKDRGSGKIDARWVRGDLVIHRQNRVNRQVIDEGAVCNWRG